MKHEMFSSYRPNGYYLALKRISELILIFLFLPFAIIIIPVLIILVWRDYGKVFFTQYRPGYKGNSFKMIKFTSMKPKAGEGNEGDIYEDDRVTNLGRFMRKHRLDELPQLWNVIRGDMALIGPRPVPYFLFKQGLERSEFAKYIYCMKPGITGWAQVHHRHVDEGDGFVEKIGFDLFYLLNFSPKLDLIVFYRTFHVIFFGIGAR